MFQELLEIFKIANRVANYITRGKSVAKVKLFKAKAAMVKYIFLDIVSFTVDRSVEAQSDLVRALNTIVSSALNKNDASKEHRILLPTGDGMCIALFPSLFDESRAYDIHLSVALDILVGVDSYNAEIEDKIRKFQIRIGLNENTDNIIVDINKNPNVAGRGINMAQRTMNKADGGQILIGEATYQTLCEREKYLDLFRPYNAFAKHGNSFQVYQFISKDCRGLNIDEPSAFKPKQGGDPKLTRFVAYYIAHTIRNKFFFEQKFHSDKLRWGATVMLYFLASDSNRRMKTQEFEHFVPRVYQPGIGTVQEQYDFYDDILYWVTCDFAEMIYDKYLSKYSSCFEQPFYSTYYALANEKGEKKLKWEYPDIWQEFFPTTNGTR